MFRRSLVALLAWTLLALGASVGTASANQNEAPAERSPSEAEASYADTELTQALITVDLLDDWIDSSPVTPQASLIEVTGSTAYQEARAEFIAEIDSFAERHQFVSATSERLNEIDKHVDALDTVTRQLRRSVARSGRTATVSLTDYDVGRAEYTLVRIRGNRSWRGTSTDPVSLGEIRIEALRRRLEVEVDHLRQSPSAKAAYAATARLTTLAGDLDQVRDLVTLGRTENQAGTDVMAEQLLATASRIPELHQARHLASTAVSGLSLVTVDAYIRGASVVDDSCPVDWTLLAGIGRIESRHGTLDDTSVQASGRVTKAILGPLLDGGATAREAEADQLAAEEEALLAERLAAEAQRIAEEEAFNASVWGQLRELDDGWGDFDDSPGSATPGEGARDDDGDADETSLKDEDKPEPLHDPLLWGDAVLDTEPAEDQTAAASSQDEADDDDEDEPEVEREFKGNGFAVIHDSDNGRLDGNARWDRAVGPMQFIPETWSYWETDGNGDGVIDPQNLYDAAASAARFLCHLSRSRGASPWTFVLGYNSSETYVRNVMAAAEDLRHTSLPDLDDLADRNDLGA